MKILFVNACVREASRTLLYARKLMKDLDGEIIEFNLEKARIQPLTRSLLAKRDALLREEKWDDPMFDCARQFAEADEIVIAAPFWDLGFPALLKIYLETVTVAGITFRYLHGQPEGLCKAKRLTYVTTSGGPIAADFGYPYVKALAKQFYGIRDTICYRAVNLDADGITPETLFEKAEFSKET